MSLLNVATTFSTTPLIRSLSKPQVNSTPKTLLDEYNNTFSSTKTPLIGKRRTIANITMDIINQRLENINRNASFNRSTTEMLDDSLYGDAKSTPTHSESIVEKATSSAATTPATETNGNGGQLKPLKRKLFAPPSLFPENSSILNKTPQKTDKKTATQKRKRNDLAGEKSTKSEEKKLPADKPTAATKKTNSRRSTLFFQETPKTKANARPTTIQETHSAMPGLVFTSMHKPQIDLITEVRQG